MRNKFILIVAMFFFATVSPADAYTTIGRQLQDFVNMRASAVSFPVGSSYRNALQTVENRVFENPSHFYVETLYDEPSVGFNNGESEVWFSSDSNYSPAVTFTWYLPYPYIVESDVVFYNGVAYTTSMAKTNLWSYGGPYRPFQTTAIHEYGHVAGLGHEADEYNIMGADWTHIHCNGSTARSYVGEDACDGLVNLYGLATSSVEDLSVSLFKRVGSSGEYSTHAQCKMYSSTTNNELAFTTYQGQRRYTVAPGQVVKVEFTWENQGKTTQTRTAGWYISSNSLITTTDSRFATQNFTLSRGNVNTTKTTLTIPSNLTPGQTYYLGAIIDYNNGLSEIDENNNAAYHIIRGASLTP
ncbi:MAG: hypothetical protein DCC43_15565 [Candidatus Brocadia sp.]|nr:hypothetical protein [Anaerolineales bacterium]MCC6325269.1 hypothetical protein [Candidatus Brocadia sp.]MCE7913016.1 hypothetical protein [Candidatus Brocadia sp. AMX3]RIJ89117.1 MAG: hypothetical protein DCC43_15565 [Candidatus Brocadia sp.]